MSFALSCAFGESPRGNTKMKIDRTTKGRDMTYVALLLYSASYNYIMSYHESREVFTLLFHHISTSQTTLHNSQMPWMILSAVLVCSLHAFALPSPCVREFKSRDRQDVWFTCLTNNPPSPPDCPGDSVSSSVEWYRNGRMVTESSDLSEAVISGHTVTFNRMQNISDESEWQCAHPGGLRSVPKRFLGKSCLRIFALPTMLW